MAERRNDPKRKRKRPQRAQLTQADQTGSRRQGERARQRSNESAMLAQRAVRSTVRNVAPGGVGVCGGAQRAGGRPPRAAGTCGYARLSDACHVCLMGLGAGQKGRRRDPTFGAVPRLTFFPPSPPSGPSGAGCCNCWAVAFSGAPCRLPLLLTSAQWACSC